MPISWVLLPILMCLVLVPGSAAAMLMNPGAEDGLNGWTPDLSGATSGNPSIIASSTSQSQGAGFPTVTPFAGSRFFNFANQASRSTADRDANIARTVSLFQTGNLGASFLTFSLDGRFQTAAPDFGKVEIEFFDTANGGGSSLGAFDTGTLIQSATPPQSSTWTAFGLSGNVPSGAASWRVELFGTVEASTFTNVFYDDLSLTFVIPEPSTGLLFAAGALLLTGFLRRNDAFEA